MHGKGNFAQASNLKIQSILNFTNRPQTAPRSPPALADSCVRQDARGSSWVLLNHDQGSSPARSFDQGPPSNWAVPSMHLCRFRGQGCQVLALANRGFGACRFPGKSICGPLKIFPLGPLGPLGPFRAFRTIKELYIPPYLKATDIRRTIGKSLISRSRRPPILCCNHTTDRWEIRHFRASPE